jgi:hypothetical protein
MRLLAVQRLTIIKRGILHRDLADQRYDAHRQAGIRLNDNVQQCWSRMSFQYNVSMFLIGLPLRGAKTVRVASPAGLNGRAGGKQSKL